MPLAKDRLRALLVAGLMFLAAWMLLGVPGRASADTAPPETLTFVGPAGGGTIRITTTADRSSVVHAEFIDVEFPTCGTAAISWYLDPAETVTSGNFAAVFITPLLPSAIITGFQGSFVSPSKIAGTASQSVLMYPYVTCPEETLDVSLTGPIGTPPDPEDLVFSGSSKSGPGTIVLTTDPSRSAITSVSLSDLEAPPCTGDNPVDIMAFFDPPLPVNYAQANLAITTGTSVPLRSLTFFGTLLTPDTMSGTIGLFSVPGCSTQLEWNAVRKGVSPPTPTPTPTDTLIPIPRMQKLPALQNLFLTRQGAKIPPATCLASSNAATLTESINIPITGTDPKDPSQPRKLGGFSFQVKYDQSKVCVTLRPGPVWTANPQQVCTIEDSATAPALQGIARINCLTLGKATVVDTSSAAGRVLALIEVRPQPEEYSQIRANQDNGQAVQINNEACKLTDLQGHAIPVFSCEDADVTIRFLEGDVEPDCAVNTLDTQAVAFRWGATKGGLVYNERFNLEPSGTQADQDIDVNDLQFVYGRFGSTCAAPWPAQAPVNPKA